MSYQRKTPVFKGKHVEGSGSILANLDTKARKSFAKCANNAVVDKVAHEKELVFEKEMQEFRHHKEELKHPPIRNKYRPHTLLYWLISASYSEIWHHFFPTDKKH